MSTKGLKLPPEPLTQDEVRALLKKCNPRWVSGLRNRALITVLYRAGLRISEALALWPKDYREGTLRVLHGKGDQHRLVGLDPQAALILEAWMEKRKALPPGPIFCTRTGGAIPAANIRRLLPRLARRAGIEKRVHAHGLRHTHAFELAGEGTPLHIIQAQLGHSNVGTTDRYIRHLNPAAVIDAMKAREWSL